MDRETRVMASSPRARLARLPESERKLLLLLVSLGVDVARERLAVLAADRRDLLAPLVAEIAALPADERRTLFAPPPARTPDKDALNARLRRESPLLGRLLMRELAPRFAPAVVPGRAADPTFARALTHLARRWLADARR